MGVVERQDFLVHPCAGGLDRFQVSWIVDKGSRSSKMNDQRLDLLVSEDSPRSSSRQLFEAGVVSFGIPVADMDEAKEGVLRPRA